MSEPNDSMVPETGTAAEGPGHDDVSAGAVDEAAPNPNFKWYVVHCFSGHENRARQSLEERIKQYDLGGQFGEVLIPTENVTEIGKGGEKKTVKRKFFPGYMLVQMELTDASWHLIRGTPKITGFVGSMTSPPAVPEAEVRRLTQQIDEGSAKPRSRVKFEEGENVRVTAGPFENFNGVVEAVNANKQKAKVLISILGRPNPVDIEFDLLEKA